MKALIYPLLAVGAFGLSVATLAHLLCLLGAAYLFEHLDKVLVIGMFVVFVPALFVMNRLAGEARNSQIWRAALRGCPRWMRAIVWFILGYAWIWFFLPLALGGRTQTNEMRVLSAVVMAFYLIPTAILYSATQLPGLGQPTRCVRGHAVSPFARFCEECGAPVDAGEQRNHKAPRSP